MIKRQLDMDNCPIDKGFADYIFCKDCECKTMLTDDNVYCTYNKQYATLKGYMHEYRMNRLSRFELICAIGLWQRSNGGYCAEK